jgi:hypothetical protein
MIQIRILKLCVFVSNTMGLISVGLILCFFPLNLLFVVLIFMYIVGWLSTLIVFVTNYYMIPYNPTSPRHSVIYKLTVVFVTLYVATTSLLNIVFIFLSNIPSAVEYFLLVFIFAYFINYLLLVFIIFNFIHRYIPLQYPTIFAVYHNKVLKKVNKNEGVACPICLEEIEAESECVETICSHQYHISCLSEWLNKYNNETCPSCRNQFSV